MKNIGEDMAGISAKPARIDFDEFVRLPKQRQAAIMERIDWIERIESTPRGGRDELKRQAASALGVSFPTITRAVAAYRAHGWRGLNDNRGSHVVGLPPAFKEFVRALWLQCSRATAGREVQRMVIERLELWRSTGDTRHKLPGYDTPPPNESTGYPRGFSEDSILRLRPDSYALAAGRQGAKASAKFLPSILKTRVGSKFGQVLFFDDQDYDLRIAAPGTALKALRPQGFNCLDYLSGCFLHHVIRLRWWDAPADQFRTLTQQDFVWFVISVLQKHGYRPDSTGTTLVFEHGTATGYSNKSLSTVGSFSDFDEALAAVSHGCVRVERSGLFNQPAFSGMLFRPASSGNPNFKAPLESMFNLVRNRMAALPGATGRNRDLKPAEEYGRDAYTAQLLKLWERLDERHRALIKFPVLTAAEFGTLADAVYEAINSRRDHALEGWEGCGFLAPQFRFTPDERSPWLSRDEVSNLPDDARMAILANSEKTGHMRTARLSPREVASLCAGELTKLPDHAIPLLIPMQWARPATVKENRTIMIKDQLLGSEPMIYIARIEDATGARVLKSGMPVLCHLNPFDTSKLIVCREDGAFLGTIYGQSRAGFSDQDAILDQLKARAEMKADMDTAVRPHFAGAMKDRALMKCINDRLANGKPVLPEEIAEARAEAARNGVRTRKVNEISAAIGSDALKPGNLLPTEDEDDLQADCTTDAGAFSAAQFLNETTEYDD
jgi:hypothetical protein